MSVSARYTVLVFKNSFFSCHFLVYISLSWKRSSYEYNNENICMIKYEYFMVPVMREYNYFNISIKLLSIYYILCLLFVRHSGVYVSIQVLLLLYIILLSSRILGAWKNTDWPFGIWCLEHGTDLVWHLSSG